MYTLCTMKRRASKAIAYEIQNLFMDVSESVQAIEIFSYYYDSFESLKFKSFQDNINNDLDIIFSQLFECHIWIPSKCLCLFVWELSFHLDLVSDILWTKGRLLSKQTFTMCGRWKCNNSYMYIHYHIHVATIINWHSNELYWFRIKSTSNLNLWCLTKASEFLYLLNIFGILYPMLQSRTVVTLDKRHTISSKQHKQ